MLKYPWLPLRYFPEGGRESSMAEPENLHTNLTINPLNTVFTDCPGVYKIEE
jgi:hypothetical protein